MVFAAGLGSRLKPLTDTLPKALVPLAGRPMIDHVLERLKLSGHQRVVVNVHAHASKLVAHLKKWEEEFDLAISNEEQLLDTGGGLKKALGSFDAKLPILVHNADIYSVIDFDQMYESFRESQADALLAVSRRKSTRQLCFNEENLLCAWRDLKNQQEIISRPSQEEQCRSFSGIHLCSSGVLTNFPEVRAFPLLPHYLKVSSDTRILPFEHAQESWFDLGTVEKIRLAEAFISA